MTIPSLPSGEVMVSGGGSLPSSFSKTENPGGAPLIEVNNTFPGKLPGSDHGPLMILEGNVDNVGGEVTLAGATGSLLQVGQITPSRSTWTSRTGPSRSAARPRARRTPVRRPNGTATSSGPAATRRHRIKHPALKTPAKAIAVVANALFGGETTGSLTGT